MAIVASRKPVSRQRSLVNRAVICIWGRLPIDFNELEHFDDIRRQRALFLEWGRPGDGFEHFRAPIRCRVTENNAVDGKGLPALVLSAPCC